MRGGFFFYELLLIISNYAANVLLSSSPFCTAGAFDPSRVNESCGMIHFFHADDILQLQHPSVGKIKDYSCRTLDVHIRIKISINVTSVSY